jgi:hypothetical protein
MTEETFGSMDDKLNRIKTAIESLKNGHPVMIDNILIGVKEMNNLYVTGWTKCKQIKDLTRDQAIIELNEIKTTFMHLVDFSSELKNFIQNKTINYNLAISYRTAGIGICSEKDGVLIWRFDLTK